MKASLFGAVFAAVSLVGGAAATADPVVVELYTSQGCNSCPPADEILGEFVDRDDVIALSLNVDYWDYLGWRDEFGKAEHTMRQRAYQASFGARTIYTPQMVVQGREGVVGNRPGQVYAAVDGHNAQPNQAIVDVERDGNALIARIAPAVEGLSGPATIWLVGYTGPHAVPIRHGENAGRTITYHNVARTLTQVSEWDCRTPVQFRVDIDPSMRGYAVIVQKDLVGPIYGAQKIEF